MERSDFRTVHLPSHFFSFSSQRSFSFGGSFHATPPLLRPPSKPMPIFVFITRHNNVASNKLQIITRLVYVLCAYIFYTCKKSYGCLTTAIQQGDKNNNNDNDNDNNRGQQWFRVANNRDSHCCCCCRCPERIGAYHFGKNRVSCGLTYRAIQMCCDYTRTPHARESKTVLYDE